MKNLIGINIKNGRLEKGMSLEKLGELSGVSKQSIHRYETGQKSPSSSTLINISNVLNIPLSQFFAIDSMQIDIDEVYFRDEHKIKNSSIDIEWIKGACRKYLKGFIELQNICSLDISFENPISDLIVKSKPDIEKAAKKVRKKWGLGHAPIHDVTKLLEDKGVSIIEVELDSSFSGLSGFANSELPFIVVNSNVNNISRKRFTTLHELAHLVLKFESTVSKDLIEEFCNQFAGAILLVDDTLKSELRKESHLNFYR